MAAAEGLRLLDHLLLRVRETFDKGFRRGDAPAWMRAEMLRCLWVCSEKLADPPLARARDGQGPVHIAMLQPKRLPVTAGNEM